MKKVKIADAPYKAIDWLAGKAQGLEVKAGCSGTLYLIVNDVPREYRPTTDPAQAWPIIGREITMLVLRPDGCQATKIAGANAWTAYGSTGLDAAMRCFCVSRYGEEAEVPEELLA